MYENIHVSNVHVNKFLWVQHENIVTQKFLNQVCAVQRPVHAWFLEIAFVRDVGMCVYVHACLCVSTSEGVNNIPKILNLYNQLNKFVALRNIMKLSMYGCSLCNEAQCDKAMLEP